MGKRLTVPAATAAILATMLVPSLNLSASGQPRNVQPRPDNTTRAALTAGDYVAFMQTEIEGLPKILVSQAESGSLISTTYSGLFSPGVKSGPAYGWPGPDICKVLPCNFDPEAMLMGVSMAPSMPKGQRGTARMIGQLLPGMVLSDMPIEEIVQVLFLLLGSDSNSDLNQMLGQMRAAESQHNNLKAAIAAAIVIINAGRKTLFNPTWLKRVRVEAWHLDMPSTKVPATDDGSGQPLWKTMVLTCFAGAVAGSFTKLGAVGGAIAASVSGPV